jgi:uncharacterized Zn finger protein
MSRYDYYDGGWPRYVPVAERRRKAERMAAKLRKEGQILTPVTITGRAIANTFWGKAWCDNIEAYSDYASRLPRGRTYVRNGSVFDLQIARGQVMALVSGSEIYRVALAIKEMPTAKWRSICADCASGIESLIELLQGRLAKGVMERLCRQDGGLFPAPRDIRFTCSCPDHASLCKHVAAVLYSIGARLDAQPELLFRLRGVDENDLVAQIDAPAALAEKGLATDKVLGSDDVSALFGLEMAEPAAEPPPDTQRQKPSRARRTAKDKVAAAAPAPADKPAAKPPKPRARSSKAIASPAKPSETARFSAQQQQELPSRNAQEMVASRAAERLGRTGAKAGKWITRSRDRRRGASAARRSGRP